MYPRSYLCEEAKIKQRTPLKKELCEIGEEVIWESRFTSFFTYLLHRGQHIIVYMNARVSQQLSALCLWNLSLLILRKHKHHCSPWSPWFQILVVNLSTSFSFRQKLSLYIPIYFLFENCANVLPLAPPKSAIAQALNAARVRITGRTWFSISSIHA